MTSRGITWAFTAEQQVTGQAACSCINITANCLFVTLGSPPGLRPLGLAHSPAGESPARRHRVCLFSALPGAGLHPGPLALGPSYLSISMPAHRCPSTASVGMGAPPSSPPPQQSQHTRGSLGAERWTEALRLHVSGQILPPTARGCPCVLWKHSWGRCPPAWSDRPLTTPLGPKKTVLPRPGRDSPKLQTPGEPQGAREPTSETGAGGWPQI